MAAVCVAEEGCLIFCYPLTTVCCEQAGGTQISQSLLDLQPSVFYKELVSINS